MANASETAHHARQALRLDLPSPPACLAEMQRLLAQPVCDMQAISALIASDMSLAAAVLKTVNSSLFGLSGRVQTVREATTYLGVRQVCGLTLQHGLRAAFPAAPELDELWERAGHRARLMGALAQSLGLPVWAAHSAGLFEECGKALLFRHAPDAYRSALVAAHGDDHALAVMEQDTFGVSHDTLGAALCETWGLAPSAVCSVRHHLEVHATLVLPQRAEMRGVVALSALAHGLVSQAERLQAMIEPLSVALGLPLEQVLAAAASAPMPA
jgi:HD-like signal output (HDOD) protein